MWRVLDRPFSMYHIRVPYLLTDTYANDEPIRSYVETVFDCTIWAAVAGEPSEAQPQ